MGKIVAAKPKSVFKNSHELTKMVRGLRKISGKALEVLEQGLYSEDEKTRMIAAEKILKFYETMAKETNTDALNRLILDVKSSGLIGQGSTADDDNTPVLNFDEIHEDFRDNVVDAENVVDLSDVSKIG